MSETAQALGQRLKAAREQRGVSAQKMADDMHLDAWVIEALEAGEYERIGPSVYAKGHLKKYASILGVSTSPVPTEPKAAGPQVPIPIVRIDPPSRAEGLWPKVGGVAAIVLVAGAIAWWRPWHRTSSLVPTAALPAPPPNAAASATAQQSPPDDTDTLPEPSTPPDSDASSSAEAPLVASSAAPSSTETPRRTSAAGEARPPAAASAPAPAATSQDLTPGVGRARLRLSFSADSRVDVYDYSGKPIFTGNGRANSVKTLAGMAPFRVYLGSASGVQLQVNDRAVAIGRQFVSGDVARFEAGADGVLRRDTRPNSTNGTQTVAVSPRG
jgi:cytoskeleton protein RodZ